MAESDEERQQRAVDLAFKRGSEMAAINGRLEQHDRHFAEINGSIDGLKREVHGLGTEVSALRSDFKQSVAVATARATDAERAVTAQVSARQFYLGLAGAVTAIGMLLLTALAAAGTI